MLALHAADQYGVDRRAAAVAMGRLGDPRAVPALLESMKHSYERKKAHVDEALEAIGAPAVPALIEALTAPAWTTRLGAVRGLGRIGDPRALDGLVAALRDPDTRVRAPAATALGQLGRVEAIEPLLSAFRRTRAMALQRSIAAALTALGWQPPSELDDIFLASLVAEGRWDELKAMGSLAVPCLLRAARDSDRHVRGMAVFALRDIGDPAAIPQLIKALNDPDWTTGDQAARALGLIGDPEAVPALIRMVKAKPRGPWDERAAHAAWALGAIGSARAVRPLCRALACDDARGLPNAAAAALGKIGSESARPALEAVLEGEDLGLRDAAAQALEQIGGRRPVGLRVKTLIAKQAWDDIVALGPKAVSALRKQLGRDDTKVQPELVRCLGRIGDLRSAAGVLDWLYARPTLIGGQGELRKWSNAMRPLFGDYTGLVLETACYLPMKCERWQDSLGDKGGATFTYDERPALRAVRELCRTHTPLASNLLRRLATKTSAKVPIEEGWNDYGGVYNYKTLRFEAQRSRAEEELHQRDDPKHLRRLYRDPAAWTSLHGPPPRD